MKIKNLELKIKARNNKTLSRSTIDIGILFFRRRIRMESSFGWFTISYGCVPIRNKEIAGQISKGRLTQSVQTEAKVLPVPTSIIVPIIQWNCRGLNINYTEITLLVQAFPPIAGRSTISLEMTFYIVVLISTDLQAVAVRISLDKTITLCFVYIPHNSSV